MSGTLKKTLGYRSRLLKLLGFLAIFASGVTVFATYTKYEAAARWQHASEIVGAELGERAARLQEWLLRVDRTLSWFRAEDVSTADRLGVTVRMLHTERFVTPATTLFLFSATGRLVAGTLPLPDGLTGIATQAWFKSIQGSPMRLGLQVTGCTRDPFGTHDGVVLYRSVLDHDAVAGYVGSFLPQAAVAAIAGDDAPAKGAINLALRSAAGEAFGCRPADPAPPVVQPRGFLRTWLSRAVHAAPAIAHRSVVAEDRPIEPGGLHLVATADVLDIMSDDEWTALAYRAGYVATTLLLIMALLSSMLHRLGRPARVGLLPIAAHPAADGADWMWELDDSGNLVGLAGNAPDHLLPPSGRSLAEVAGPIGSHDMRWERLTAAICAKHAFEGLQVPFQIPGRSGLLTIFEFSGQPVVASGGFWGTASLVSEESIARGVRPSLAKAELSVV